MRYEIGMEKKVYEELPTKIKDRIELLGNEGSIVSTEIAEEDVMKDLICYCFKNKIKGATELLEGLYVENETLKSNKELPIMEVD